MMSEIWVVGEPKHDLSQFGAVHVVDPVVIDTPPGPGYPMRRRYDHFEGIKQAMSVAVKKAKLGDLIIQNDVELTGDPFTGEKVVGSIRLLVTPRIPHHHCPQAFIVYDNKTRDAILEAWADTRDQSCIAWGPLSFVTDLTVAVHRRQT